MKKIMLFASVLAGLFLAASCQQENLEPVMSGNTVTYTVQVPEAIATKAIGDQVTAVDKVYYEVYRAAEVKDLSKAPVYQGEELVINNSASFDLEFVKNQDFVVLFWAQDADLVYDATDNPTGMYDIDDLRQIQLVNPGAANNDAAQVFAGKDEVSNCTSDANGSVTLTRPVSQINVYTTAESLIFGDVTIGLDQSSMTVAGLYNTFNVATGDAVVSDENKATFEYAEAAVPTADADNSEYKYVAMNYVGFASQAGTTATVDFTIWTTTEAKVIEHTVSNVPVKPNFRTNIIGNLITSMSDYTITLDSEWAGVYVGPEFVQEPAYDAETKTWTVTNAMELAWVAASVNGSIGLNTKAAADCKTFEGETVVLANDIDLEGAEWDPIGTPSSYFTGTFDGQDHKVENFKVTEKDGYAGLFGYARAKIKNLTVKNVTLKAYHYAGGIVGQGYSYIDDCHAEDINIILTIDPAADGGKGDFGDKAGAIIGQNNEGGLSVTNCTAKNVIIEGYRDLGGIAGMAHDNNIVTGNSVENVTIIQNLEGAYKSEKPTTLGAIAGRWGSNVTEENNSGNANITTAIASGVYASKTQTDSENNTTVTEYSVYAAEGIEWVASQVDEGCTFENVTIQLSNDLDLSNDNWNPIGDNRTDAAFSGTFDGNGHTIKGAHITGDHCFNGAVYGSKEGWGLFSVTDGATIKNLKVDGATFASYTVISGTIAGYANNTTFENIEISNTKISGYNWYTGGVVGWAAGNCTFKGIDLDSTTSVGTLWDSHGQSAGGIAGGISSKATITIEDCNIACVMDVINDVTSNYKWYLYRVSGMLIGNTNTTETVYQTVVTASATNVTCQNVTVTYGDWMNYHYCEGFWNRGWGRYESSDYVGGVDQYEPHNHPDGESHYVCIPFDQLFGGGPNGDGHYPVKGLAEFPGVTVIYPASYVRSVSSFAGLKEALKHGVNVVLENDIQMTETLSCTNKEIVIDGNNHTITQTDDCANPYALFDLNGGKFTIKNVTFDGVKGAAAVRTVNTEFHADRVIVKNAEHTIGQGLFRLAGAAATLQNCTFNDNNCLMAVSFNFDAATDVPLIVENCLFENNTCSQTAVMYYVDGSGATINGNKFIGNTVNCSSNGATVYMGFSENNVVTNNLFQNNTVNEASTSSRVAGGVFFGYETEFTGNAFVGNKVTGTNAKGNDVCVSTYYTDIDLSGNYWGGNAPVADVNYFQQHKDMGHELVINDYLTQNPIL